MGERLLFYWENRKIVVWLSCAMKGDVLKSLFSV